VGKRFLASLHALLLATVLLSSTPGCGGEEDAQLETFDLISHIDILKLRAETGSAILDSVFTPFYLESGWSEVYEADRDGALTVAAVARESKLRLRIVRPADRWLAFRVRKRGKYRGPKKQDLTVTVWGEKLAKIRLKNETVSHVIMIPGRLQREGINEVVFRFSDFLENNHYLGNYGQHKKNPYIGVAAYFSNMRVLGSPESDTDSGEDMVEASAVTPLAESGALRQAANSSISYVVEHPEGAALSFSGAFAQQSDKEEELEVVVSTRADSDPAWKRIWSRKVFGRDGKEKRSFSGELPIGSAAGSPVEIKLALFSSKVLSGASLVWKKIELRIPERKEPGPEKPVRKRRSRHVENAIIIVIDAARPDLFGCYGDERGATPNIDRFAGSAVVFRDAVSSAPYTISSVSTIFSGLTPETHGVTGVNMSFPEGLQNMAGAFKEKAFFTAALAGVLFAERKHKITNDCEMVVDLRSKENILADYSAMEFEPIRKVLDAAKGSGKPLFLYAHFLPPHWPYRPPEPFSEKYIADPDMGGWRLKHDFYRVEADFTNGVVSRDDSRVLNLEKLYLNNLAYADDVVGRFLAMLKKYGYYEDSIIIVTADHGEAFGEHGFWGHNRTVYGEMMRVPMLVRIPGGRAGEVDELVGLIDIFPTMNEIFDLGLDPAAFEGRSIVGLLEGGRIDPGVLYYQRADHKDVFSLRGRRFKFISDHFREELYDLLEDPKETVNIVGRRPVLAGLLRQRVLRYRAFKAAAGGLRAGEVELTEEEEKELRDLGYIHE